MLDSSFISILLNADCDKENNPNEISEAFKPITYFKSSYILKEIGLAIFKANIEIDILPELNKNLEIGLNENFFNNHLHLVINNYTTLNSIVKLTLNNLNSCLFVFLSI